MKRCWLSILLVLMVAGCHWLLPFESRRQLSRDASSDRRQDLSERDARGEAHSDRPPSADGATRLDRTKKTDLASKLDVGKKDLTIIDSDGSMTPCSHSPCVIGGPWLDGTCSKTVQCVCYIDLYCCFPGGIWDVSCKNYYAGTCGGTCP